MEKKAKNLIIILLMIVNLISFSIIYNQYNRLSSSISVEDNLNYISSRYTKNKILELENSEETVTMDLVVDKNKIYAKEESNYNFILAKDDVRILVSLPSSVENISANLEENIIYFEHESKAYWMSFESYTFGEENINYYLTDDTCYYFANLNSNSSLVLASQNLDDKNDVGALVNDELSKNVLSNIKNAKNIKNYIVIFNDEIVLSSSNISLFNNSDDSFIIFNDETERKITVSGDNLTYKGSLYNQEIENENGVIFVYNDKITIDDYYSFVFNSNNNAIRFTTKSNENLNMVSINKKSEA